MKNYCMFADSLIRRLVKKHYNNKNDLSFNKLYLTIIFSYKVM